MAKSKNTFIFFESWEKYLKILEQDKDKNYANEMCRAIVQYGLYGECDTTDKTIISRIDAICLDLMQNAKDRYVAAKKDGSTGGRPPTFDRDKIKELYESGISAADIADELGCTKRTVNRVLEDLQIYGDEI